MKTYQTAKRYDGFSVNFRQWRATTSHCRFLHGYGASVRIVFQGELDERNWVWDFGGFRRTDQTIEGMKPAEWLYWLLDHTTLIASDDPELGFFEQMAERGLIQLRILPRVSAEAIAEYIYSKLECIVREQSQDRVRILRVEFNENERNTASVEVAGEQ